VLVRPVKALMLSER